MPRHEIVLLTGAEPAPGPGAVTSALFRDFGVPADAVGAIDALPEAVAIQVEAAQARRIPTPCPLVLGPRQRGVLRRDTDLPQVAGELIVRWQTEPSSAGAVARALHGAGVAGEEVGPIQRAEGGIETTLPRWRYRPEDFPSELDGHSLAVEKKNARDRWQTNAGGASAPCRRGAIEHGGLSEAEDALSALRAVADRAEPADLARAVRTALRRGRHDPELVEAARRLVGTGFAPRARHVTAPPGLIALTRALAGPRSWRGRLAALESIPFPTPDDRAAMETLRELLVEHQGELTPASPLAGAVQAAAREAGYETRVLGTLCPGLRGDGITVEVTPAPPGDGIWDRWLSLAGALARGDAPDPADLRTLDRQVRDAADAAGLSLGTWPKLVALVEAEAAGEAEPALTPVEQLSPGSPRWEAATLRAIDAAVAAGRWDEARGLAARAIEQQPASVDLARRHARLSARTDAATDDPITLVHAGEAALRARATDAAVRAFEAAGAPAGTPAAHHTARRLVELKRPEAAKALLTTESPAWLREKVAVALEDWPVAVEAWAEQQGPALGFGAAPSWADAAVMALLPPEHRALGEGHLERASNLIEGLGQVPTARGGDPLALIFESPDPRPALQALAADPERAGSWTSLAIHLLREVPEGDWDPDTIEAAVASAEASGEPDVLLRGVGAERLAGWLDGPVDTRVAAVLRAAPELPQPLAEVLEHSPPVRLETARGLLEAGRGEDAANAAASLLRRAHGGEVQWSCARIILDSGHPEALLSLLTPERDGTLLMSILTALMDEDPLPDALMPAVKALAQAARRPAARLAATLLADAGGD